MMNRRGFTLVEMLVALILLAIVGGVIYKVLISQQRLTRAQTEQASLQSNVRTGALMLPTELRELGSGSIAAADIIHMDADSITYRAMRSTGVACNVTTTMISVREDMFYGARPPEPVRDSVLLFVEANPNISGDDTWVTLQINAVISGGAFCGATPAMTIITSIPPATVNSIAVSAPVRTFEVMRLKLYAQGGQNWLGASSISMAEPYEAVLGPLTANGLNFVYRDSVGGITAVRERVRTIDITIRGVSDRTVHTASGNGPVGRLQDSLFTRVALRNAPRF